MRFFSRVTPTVVLLLLVHGALMAKPALPDIDWLQGRKISVSKHDASPPSPAWEDVWAVLRLLSTHR